MVTTADQHYVNMYNSNIELLYQQTDNRISKWVRNETQEGEYEFFNQVGTLGYTTISGRAVDTVLNTPTHYRRRVGLSRYSINPYLDKADEVKMGWADPTSTYVLSAAATKARIMDDLVITALDGTAYTDKTGSTGTVYSTSNDITVSGSLLVSHLRSAKAVLDANEVPDMDRFLIMGALDMQSLLADDEMTSSDYNELRPLRYGDSSFYMGFNIVRSERCGVSGAARKIFFGHKNAILLSQGAGPAGMFSRIDERADVNYTKQLYTHIMAGATRMQETGIGRILRTA